MKGVEKVMDLTPGELMRIRRLRKGLTQIGLAEVVGSYQVRVSRLENEIETPTDEEVEKIENVLCTRIWSSQEGDAKNGA